MNLFDKTYLSQTTLTKYLSSQGITQFEGFTQQIPQQVEDLKHLVKSNNIKKVLEIGFNAGHSSEIFLENNKDCTVLSFDLGIHDYVQKGKEFIDKKYQNRHTLILGDSTRSIPDYYLKNNSEKFDLIFIDGGHSYSVSKQDLLNCRFLAHKDSIIIMDDTYHSEPVPPIFMFGPTLAWCEEIDDDKIIPIQQKDYTIGRGMSWGKYKKLFKL